MSESVNRLSPEERYRRDPWFSTLVDMLYRHLEQGHLDEALPDFTPTELREACILACTKYEMRHPRPILIDSAMYRP